MMRWQWTALHTARHPWSPEVFVAAADEKGDDTLERSSVL
jgi:hypothetical protein